MPWINSAEISRGKDLDEQTALSVYNGLDACVTFEIWESQNADLSTVAHGDSVRLIYGFERAMQAPSFVMSRRGVLVDRMWRGIIRSELANDLQRHDNRFQALADAVWDIPFVGKKPLNIYPKGHPCAGRAFSLNYNSPNQLKEFFYGALQHPEVFTFAKGERRVTTNREALETLEKHRWAGIFARYIMKMRDLHKKVTVLSKQLSPDGRMRCSYNVAGTETGRWSSSEDPFGDGDNLQNWTKKMRRCVVADEGKKLFSVDLAQAESFITGGCAYRDGKDLAYLEACRSGDLHTSVTKDIWPYLDWAKMGDNIQTEEQLREANKEIAERPFYFALSYRDTSKRLGHGTNYYGQPPHLSKTTKIPHDSVVTFQNKYFNRFKGIRAYHQMQSNRLQMDFFIETALGRVRHFFGRPDDTGSLRKAIAFEPQSTVGDLLNLGLWRVWNHLDAWGPSKGPLELLLQVHDNIVFQLDDDPDDPNNAQRQEEIVQCVLDLLTIPVFYLDQIVQIPADVETGWNWAPVKVDKKNTDGLIPWKRGVPDARRRHSSPSAPRLDRLISWVHRRCKLAENLPTLVWHRGRVWGLGEARLYRSAKGHPSQQSLCHASRGSSLWQVRGP